MPQISNIRLLLSSTNHRCHPFSAAFLYFSPFPLKPRKHKSPFFITFSSYSKNSNGNNKNSRGLLKRNETTLREVVKKEDTSNSEKIGGFSKMEEMKESSGGFNRKRAEGRDGNDEPKRNLQRKVRKLNPANTLSYVQILGTGMDTQDTSPSVLLFFDKQRFIFNAGEGLQRFCSEHKIKLSKIDHIFLSRVCSETAGGLPGLLLTLAGMGDEGVSVNVWGSSDLKYLVDAMKSFVPNAAIVHSRSFGPGLRKCASETPNNFDDPLVLIDDEVVKISALLLRPRQLELSESMEGKDPHDLGGSPKSENSTRPGDLSVIYLCELPEIKGKFDPRKAVALGLRPGPKYRELQLGNSVQSDRQDVMVHPSDVMGPSVPGPIVFLVDCPTLMHLEELLSLKCLIPYYIHTIYDAPADLKVVNCIIHLSPTHVTKTDDYQIWMSRFGAAQHIMAGHEMRNIEVPILKSSARIAARLNYVCPQFFPSPGFWSMEPTTARASNKLFSSRTTELIAAENLLKFHMRPYANLGLDRSSIPNLSSSSEIIDELLSEIPEIVDASKQVNRFWLDNGENNAEEAMTEEPWLPENTIPSCLEDISRQDMEIVLLGTGSSQPSKYRNVSSIFINLFSKGSLLLDCGEGTLGQLKRRSSVKYKMTSWVANLTKQIFHFDDVIRYLMEDVPKFGIKGADEAIRGLRCIWISHIHADHHTGLARVLALRRDLLKGSPHEPIIVVGPRQLKRFLDAYQRLEDLDMQFLDCWHTSGASLEALESSDDTSTRVNENVDSTLFVRGSRMRSYFKTPGDAAAIPILKSLKKVLVEAGLETLISFPVVHCPQAFGVALEASSRVNSVGKTIPGWKIVYSGDTRPCPELVKASRGATVLIHEATFEDSMVEEAIARNHSTTKEAIETGDAAGAYRIILTHFSQRYPKIPVFDETHMHKTCIAFDMMSVNVADVHVLPKVLPHLKLLFRDDMIVDESEDVDLVATVA